MYIDDINIDNNNNYPCGFTDDDVNRCYSFCNYEQNKNEEQINYYV